MTTGKTLHPMNETRADWARVAVDAFGVETYAGRTFTGEAAEFQPGDNTENSDAYTMIQDLIGDALHLATRHGWDAGEMIRKAVASFDYENAPEYAGD